jgi:Ca2+:H+ antiporter
MTLACITLVIPAAYHLVNVRVLDTISATGTNPIQQPTKEAVISALDDSLATDSGLLVISRGTALLLLLVYFAYLVFQLKTHAHLFVPDREDAQEVEEAKMSTVSAAAGLLLVTVVTSFCADYCK